jgi:kynurenine formamidase
MTREQAPVAGWPQGLGVATSLARTLDFAAPHPRAFGAPAATSTALVVGGFNGEVARGASCNCRSVTLVPHCNGTHTESAAHLTLEALPLGDIVPFAPLPALLLSVSPANANQTTETADPPPQPGDRLITAASIDAAWRAAQSSLAPPRLLVLRTAGAEDGEDPAYLTLEAMRLIVARSIEHLVVDLPSVDRSDDQGRLGAHRVFFGLPPGSTQLAEARRAHATITEFALIPATCAEGPCAVQLQLAPWTGDAVPSRPIHFALTRL